MWHAQTAHFAPQMTAAIDQPARNHSIRENLLIVVNIVEEEIEGGDALCQTLLDGGPFLRGNNAWEEIIGPDAFSPLVIAIDGKGDTLIQKRPIGCLLALLQRLQRHFEQAVVELLISRMWLPVGSEHLVEHPVKRVGRERRWQNRAFRSIG